MYLYLIFLILTSCASTTHWSTDGIAAGDRAFDSKRIRYHSAQAHPPLQFEMVKMGSQIDAFVSLTHFRFTDDQVKIQFTTPSLTFEDQLLVHEGRMKAHLSPEATQKLIQALQAGEKVAILLDGFEETLDPAQFSGSFSEFAKDGTFFQNFFRGPIR